MASSSEDLLGIWDVVLRLLAASVVHSAVLSEWSCPAEWTYRSQEGLDYYAENGAGALQLNIDDLH
jgi:hypothetical protein